MLPLSFFAGMLTLTLVAFLAQLASQRRVARHLGRLAGEWGMHYAPTDCFRLTARVIARFPVAGASDLCVVNVVYTQEADRYRYFFTVQYTSGVVRTKTRISRVATFCEEREARSEAGWTHLVLAPIELALLQQYVYLRDAMKTTAIPEEPQLN